MCKAEGPVHTGVQKIVAITHLIQYCKYIRMLPCAFSCISCCHKWHMSGGRTQAFNSRAQFSVSDHWLPVSGPVSLTLRLMNWIWVSLGRPMLHLTHLCFCPGAMASLPWHPGCSPHVSDAVFYPASFVSSISWQLGECDVDKPLCLITRSILRVPLSFHSQLSYLEESLQCSGFHPL